MAVKSGKLKEPRILIWDIETLPNLKEVMRVFPQLSDYPGLTLKAQFNSIICFGYKFLGDKSVKCINAWDFPEWDKDVNADGPLIDKALEILSKSDAIVTHNGKRFDWKFFQTRLLIQGKNLLHKIPHIDTCAVSKSNLFGLNNRLNTLAKLTDSGQKLENGGWDLWCKVLERETKSMELMTRYCKQDVAVLEKVFLKLRPLISNLPNWNLFTDTGEKVCPSCGSIKIQSYGLRRTKTNLYRRFRCNDCLSVSQSPISRELLRSE